MKIILILCTLLSTSIVGQTSKITQLYPESPSNYVTDMANIINDESLLNNKLKMLQNNFHVEVAIVTLPTIQNYTPFDVALSIGRTWGVANKAEIGDSTRNAGLVMLIVPKTTATRGQCYIATARGVEGFLTDNTVADICRNMISYFKVNNYDDGINFGINSITEKITYNINKTVAHDTSNSYIILTILIICLIIAIIIMVISVRLDARRTYRGDKYKSVVRNSPHTTNSSPIIPSRHTGLTEISPNATLYGSTGSVDIKDYHRTPSVPDNDFIRPSTVDNNNFAGPVVSDNDDYRRSYDSPSDTSSTFDGYSGGTDSYAGGGGGDSW